MSIRPILLSSASPAGQGRHPEGKLLGGDATYRSSTQYQDAGARFSAGVWEAGPCVLQASYDPDEQEFCLILEGEARLTGRDGHVALFRRGDAFVVPGGWEGTWECIGKVRKYYVSGTALPAR